MKIMQLLMLFILTGCLSSNQSWHMGEDSNQDGIRDDIALWINNKYKQNETWTKQRHVRSEPFHRYNLPIINCMVVMFHGCFLCIQTPFKLIMRIWKIVNITIYRPNLWSNWGWTIAQPTNRALDLKLRNALWNQRKIIIQKNNLPKFCLRFEIEYRYLLQTSRSAAL